MTAETLIIGGGLAGPAAAIQLARAGRDVVLAERESQPQHKVCGEFLSEETLESLALLGVDPSHFGAARLHSVRLSGVTSSNHSEAAASLPFRAMSLTRRALDEALLQQAEAVGVRVLRGANVQALLHDSGQWRAQTAAGALQAPTVFLATGKHDLRSLPRPAGRQSDLIGFKMYFALAPAQAAALDGHVELHLYRGGYAGLQPVEADAANQHVANLCCVVRRAEYQRLGARWEKLLAAMGAQSPLLSERLLGAQPLLQRPLAIAPIPYGYVRHTRNLADDKAPRGLWYLGDQAAVIPSFTGDGMAIALHSGTLAAEMHLRGAGAGAYQQQLHHDVARQVGLATLVSRGLVSPLAPVMQATAAALPSLLRLIARKTRLHPQAISSQAISAHRKPQFLR